jgi:hypothetical protein
VSPVANGKTNKEKSEPDFYCVLVVDLQQEKEKKKKKDRFSLER